MNFLNIWDGTPVALRAPSVLSQILLEVRSQSCQLILGLDSLLTAGYCPLASCISLNMHHVKAQ